MHRTLTTIIACSALIAPQFAAMAQATNNGRYQNSDSNYANGYSTGGAGTSTLTCESWNYQYKRCAANTGNFVQLSRRIAGNCQEGRNWGYDRSSIWVDGGCRAQFRYGASGGGGYPPSNGRNFAGQIRCESWNYAYRRCNAATNGRVELVRTVAGTCDRGRSWGFDNNSIWVNHGCRGEFGYGYGSNNSGGSSNTGGVVAGVALAAGLIALLAATSNSNKKTQTPQITDSAPPAQIVANLSTIPVDRRPSAQTCLDEAARQIGATGGTQISLDRINSLTRINTGWEFVAQLVTSYPDETRTVQMTCRANGLQLLAIDFGA